MEEQKTIEEAVAEATVEATASVVAPEVAPEVASEQVAPAEEATLPAVEGTPEGEATA
jgi:hypothetical protein